MTHDVFISHSSQDRDVADAACAALELRGFRCWIAPRDVASGRDYGEAIMDGIHASCVFVLIFSAATNESPQARREVERAAIQGLPIISFSIADVAPATPLESFIGSAQWLDALTPPIAPHLDYLGDTVAQTLEKAAPGSLQLTVPPRPLPPRRRAYYWLPIVAAGLAGLVAIAVAAAYVARAEVPPVPPGERAPA